jgi:hypothetical protein
MDYLAKKRIPFLSLCRLMGKEACGWHCCRWKIDFECGNLAMKRELDPTIVKLSLVDSS